MIDGFGEAYYRNSDMPTLNFMEKHGIFKVVKSLMPSVTNVNNASICTGELPEKNGITGNSFYNTATGLKILWKTLPCFYRLLFLNGQKRKE
ncbi:MAG: alkaline phosphatase family protein [Bacteroidota bacterium]